MRYPASWRTDQAEQDGVWYRYFLAPGTGPEKKPAVSVTLLAGPLGVPVEQYAATYLAENKLESSREEERQGTRGRSYAFTSADGGMRYSLLLLAAEQKVYGLYAQGDAAGFAKHADAVAEMQKSFTLERPASWPLVRGAGYDFSLRRAPLVDRGPPLLRGGHPPAPVHEPAAPRRARRPDRACVAHRDRGGPGPGRPRALLPGHPGQAGRSLPGARATRPGAKATWT